MDQENCTIITIQPPKNSNLKSASFSINQKFIDKERLDVLQKGCYRAWVDFIYLNNWKIIQEELK